MNGIAIIVLTIIIIGLIDTIINERI